MQHLQRISLSHMHRHTGSTQLLYGRTSLLKGRQLGTIMEQEVSLRAMALVWEWTWLGNQS